MKKTAIILLIALLLPVLFACNGGDEISVQESSSEESTENVSSREDASSKSAETSEKETSKEESEESKEPEIPISERVQYATVVSTGCSYTTNVEAASQYADTYNGELTDGEFAEAFGYSEERYAGYAPGSVGKVVVTVDLGKVYDNLYQFDMSYLHTTDAGISPPGTVVVEASADGKEWVKLGTAARPVGAENGTGQIMSLQSKDFVVAQFVRFTATKQSAWLFFDEVLVYANEENSEQASKALDLLLAKYEKEELTSSQREKNLSSVKGDKIDRTKSRLEISAGRPYTLSEKTVSEYTDKNNMLTDGAISGILEGETWVGFDGTKQVVVTIDFGKTRTDLAEFEVRTYKARKADYPMCITFAVGETKDEMTEIGRAYRPADGTGLYVFSLSLARAVKGRYVQFVIDGSESDMMLLEECGVYAYGEAVALQTLYPEIKLPKVTKDVLWKKESDYEKKQNLLKGLPVQISAGFAENDEMISNNTPVTSTLLTNGSLAIGNNIHGGEYFKFCRGGQRSVIFDLTALSSVQQINGHFLSYKSWGVSIPSIISVYLSKDAEKWICAGTLQFDNLRDEASNFGYVKFENPVAARFVCFAFDAGTWSASDEMEVIGTKKITDDTIDLSALGKDSGSLPTQLFADRYQGQDASLLGGSGDICLMYYGSSLNNTVESLLPYVAYLDRDGNIKDTMFDGFLFLLSGTFPSGAHGYEGSKMSDWEWNLNQLFASGKNIDALNTVAGQVNEALGTPGRKYNFYVTLYYLRPEITNFGDVDGDGTGEDLSVLENRFKVIRWYLDKFEAKLKEANYENLSFEGYYWYHESVPGTTEDPDSVTMLQGISKIIHERGSQFFWIPYYTSSGYSEWSTFGFDTACMQPNYAFHAEVMENRLDQAAAFIKKLGMCVEMEIDDKALGKEVFFKKYMNYLKHGTTNGYMKDAIHMYYQSGSIFRAAYESNSEKIRLIYEYTYQFVKKTLDIYPDTVADISISCEKEQPVTGKLDASGKDYSEYRIYLSPEHGTLTLAEDGSYCYFPDKGFTGKDTFYYSYSEQLDYSDGCKVVVEVK